MRRSLVVDTGLDKLQELLLGMSEGDEISVPRGARRCAGRRVAGRGLR
jgi:hypothetical protein